MKFKLKNNYETKINTRSKWGGIINSSNERKNRGVREIQTIINLSNYFLPSANLSSLISESQNQSFSLLDIGCGDKYLEYGCKAYGINYDGIDYSDCDIESESVKRENESFDVVTCLALIEHLKDPSNLLNEAYRLLKKKGILLLSTPNWNYCVKTFFDDPTHVHPYTPKSLKSLIELTDFSCIKVVPNLRLKKKSSYIGYAPFFRASILRPFTNSPRYRFLPSFLKGKAFGLFGIALKN